MIQYLIFHGEDGDLSKFESESSDIHQVLTDFKKNFKDDSDEIIHQIFVVNDVTPKDMTPYNPKPKDEMKTHSSDATEQMLALPGWWNR